MYKIGIVGHRPHQFGAEGENIRGVCFRTALELADQYSPNRICFNTSGAPGVAQWFGQACLKYGLDYELFLPCEVDEYAQDWYDGARLDFLEQLDNCCGLTVAGQELTPDTVCASMRTLVDESDFMVSFWEGSRYGLTYETIKYAVDNSKIVLDGLNDLSLIMKKELQPNREAQEYFVKKIKLERTIDPLKFKAVGAVGDK